MFDIEDIEEMRYKLLKIMQDEPAPYRQYSYMIGINIEGTVLKRFIEGKSKPQFSTLLKIRNFLRTQKDRTYA